MSSRSRFIAVSLLASTFASAATSQQIRDAIGKGKEYLYSIQKNGNWEIEEKIHGQKTGQTAVVLYALLAGGENANDPRLAPAIKPISEIGYRSFTHNKLGIVNVPSSAASR